MVFFQRVVEGVKYHFVPLNDITGKTCLPVLIGDVISEKEADLFCLPLQNAGLAITNPVKQPNIICKHKNW